MMYVSLLQVDSETNKYLPPPLHSFTRFKMKTTWEETDKSHLAQFSEERFESFLACTVKSRFKR